MKQNRRRLISKFLLPGLASCVLPSFIAGCSHDQTPSQTSLQRGDTASSKLPELVWGRLGLSDGRFQKPRAMTIDESNQLYIVDKTGRIQVFNSDGKFLRKWNTPDITNGKPTGLGINREGLVMVADTHYFQILFYTRDGKLLSDRTIGGTHGPEIGQFAFVTDAIQDRHGNYFISEYGEFDRIQKYSSEGQFICRFGETGDRPLQFSRPQSMMLDAEDNLWISDACNHRIQVIRCEEDRPEIIKMFGRQGTALGEFRYPYGIHLDGKQSLYVAEFGNHRIQKLTLDGTPIQAWGSPGKKPGELQQPWTLTKDSQGRLHVLDSGNNRVQRVVI